jgi:hypothetical protein
MHIYYKLFVLIPFPLQTFIGTKNWSASDRSTKEKSPHKCQTFEILETKQICSTNGILTSYGHLVFSLLPSGFQSRRRIIFLAGAGDASKCIHFFISSFYKPKERSQSRSRISFPCRSRMNMVQNCST